MIGEETKIYTEKVICIKNTNTNFTIGEQYEINTVKFTSGSGVYQTYSQYNGFFISRANFVTLDEWRQMKLNEMGI